MDRPFLDANVLFSLAYGRTTALLHLLTLDDTRLLTSPYALEEARRNLEKWEQKKRLQNIVRVNEIEVTSDVPVDRPLPEGIHLPEKDAPILLAALEATATHLLTGDIRHFGDYFGQEVEGVLILRPSTYLRRRKRNR